ncbi:hypothetical protein HOLleu_00011 [Holothuria leucospilota]|uniref:Uncharacterized protein n=1 Tax=Holothuria leucospilota TaxID=206669 RepID=A0A9Q1CNH1_HOLLE|nr:hypothetical protein HOLleu_00011 [Holothuria leucospilota]
MHKDQEKVNRALQEQNQQQRNKMFADLKKEGLYKRNVQEIMKGSTDVVKLRDHGSSPPVFCIKCKGTYSQSNFRKHKLCCTVLQAEAPPAKAMSPSLYTLHEENGDFTENILARLKKDEIGQACLADDAILTVGKSLWHEKRNKKDKQLEGRKAVMKAMRRLGALVIQFKEEMKRSGKDEEEVSVIKMFERKNFQELEETIRYVTARDDTEESLKYGLKNELKFLMKKAAFILKADLLVKEKDQQAKEIEKFEVVFEMRKHTLFADAEYQMLKNRQVKTRKPQEQPIEQDVIKIKEFIQTKTSQMLNDNAEWTASEFSLLRDLIVCRLTLFNARRGGEPCRLTLQEWGEAAKGCWIDPEEQEKIEDPLEKELVKRTKIAYQTGKGNNRLVSVLIPEDCLNAVMILANADIRAVAGIPTKNMYLFPYTQQSMDHPSGWYCVNRVAKMAELKDITKMTATGMRHRVSTMFAMMDVPDFDRERFYDHMGHSKNINKHVYQAPLAISTITKVGKHLYNFDNGKCSFCTIIGSCITSYLQVCLNEESGAH